MRPLVLLLGVSLVFAVLLASGSVTKMFGQQPTATLPTSAGLQNVPQNPAALGYLNLHKRHPDAAEGPIEFNREYSSDAAMSRMTQLKGFLESFGKLTAKVRNRLTRAELLAVGNTGSDMQTIGFHNIPLVVEGTILKQEYRFTQVEYELAQLKHVSARELEERRAAYAEATKKFQVFWDTRLPTD